MKFDLNLLLDVDADGDFDVINSEENDNARDGKAGLGVVCTEPSALIPNYFFIDGCTYPAVSTPTDGRKLR